MVEVLDRLDKREKSHGIRWHDEISGVSQRYIISLNEGGEDLAYGASPIAAETGFKASVLCWDKIRSDVTQFPWKSYHNFTVKREAQLKSWEVSRRPKFSSIDSLDPIRLTTQGDLPRSD